ncbi:MAG: PqqD family protein [Lentisphaerae bacterium]|nr:PqqD family protein [Lentisphaerota bacterium]
MRKPPSPRAAGRQASKAARARNLRTPDTASDAAPEPADWLPTLRAIPRRNLAAQATADDGAGVCLRVRQQRPSFMKPPLSWIVPFKDTKVHQLDELGSDVWRMCDGHRHVEAVIDAFAARYSLSFHEARVAVTSYLRLLVQRGILAVELGQAT